jgi:hypothetical protein
MVALNHTSSVHVEGGTRAGGPIQQLLGFSCLTIRSDYDASSLKDGAMRNDPVGPLRLDGNVGQNHRMAARFPVLFPLLLLFIFFFTFLFLNHGAVVVGVVGVVGVVLVQKIHARDRTCFSLTPSGICALSDRYTLWCKWDGAKLAADWSECKMPELYNHTADTSLYDVEHNGENINLAGASVLKAVEVAMKSLLLKRFDPGTAERHE